MKWGGAVIGLALAVFLFGRRASANPPSWESDEPDDQGDDELPELEPEPEPEADMPSSPPSSAHFSFREFQSPDGVDVPRVLWPNLERLQSALEVIRTALGNVPVTITPAGGYRTQSVNDSNPGRAKRSQHLVAKAADIRVAGMSPRDVAAVIYQLQDEHQIPLGGLKAYSGFTHVDIRGFRPKNWGYTP